MSRFTLPNTTQVPNLLFDDLLADLSGAELKVVLYLIRRTFGFQREADAVSLSQFSEGITTRDGRQLDKGTGLTRRSVRLALEALEKRGLIVVERASEEHGGAAVNVYRLHLPEPERVGYSVSQGRVENTLGVGYLVSPQNQGNKTKVTKAAAVCACETEKPAVEKPKAAAAENSQESSKPLAPPASTDSESASSMPAEVNLIDVAPASLAKLAPETLLARFRAEHPDRWGRVARIEGRPDVKFPRKVQHLEALAILEEIRAERRSSPPQHRTSQPDVSKLYGSDPRFLEAQRKAAERQAAAAFAGASA